MDKTGIYVVTHKNVNLTLPNCYKKIAVGSLVFEELNGEYIKDNKKDNISSKNANYCELTAHYWMWKNAEADVIGLCHYRRFFTKKIFSNSINYVLTEADILKTLESGYDIILPYRPCARRTVRDIYCDFGFLEDWNILRGVIAEKTPDYLKEFDALTNRHSNYCANMLICKKELFDEYSKWLFDILFEVEKRVNLEGYDNQQARIFGFMSERLLEV